MHALFLRAKDEWGADAQEFAVIGAGDAGIGGQAVEVIETFSWSPWR